MADINGINGTNPLASLQSAGRTIRITPTIPNQTQTARPADTYSFSQAAQRANQASPAAPTYGVQGLHATTPAAAREALAQSDPQAGRQMVAGKVDAAMDYRSGEVRGNGGLPFYANPAVANGVATSTSVARLGGSLDTSG